MAETAHQNSYLDYCVHPKLSGLVLSQQPAVLFSEKIDEIFWSNAAGATFFGSASIGEILSSRPSPSQTFIAQVIDAVEQLEGNQPLSRGFRLVSGLRSQIIECDLQIFGQGMSNSGVLLLVNGYMDQSAPSENVLAGNAVRALEGFAHSATVIDDKGLVIAASSSFSDIDVQPNQLSALAQRLASEQDHLIKEPLKSLDGSIFAVGAGRISENPGRSLIVFALPTQIEPLEVEENPVALGGEPFASVGNSQPSGNNSDDIDSHTESLLEQNSVEESDDNGDTTEAGETLSNQPTAPEDKDPDLAAEAEASPETTTASTSLSGSIYHRASHLMSRWSGTPAASPFQKQPEENDTGSDAEPLAEINNSEHSEDQPQSEDQPIVEEAMDDPSELETSPATSDSVSDEHSQDDGNRSDPLATSLEQETEETIEDDDIDLPDNDEIPNTTDIADTTDDAPLENNAVSLIQTTDSAESEQDSEPKNASGPFRFNADEETVRFAWTTDQEQEFMSVSDGLAATVGPNAADIVGRKWHDLSAVFGFDENGSVERLLSGKDTWSGKTVLWPVQGTDLRVPIDLAALPAFNAQRNFEGFRGFGIIRVSDAVLDPEATGLALSPNIDEGPEQSYPGQSVESEEPKAEIDDTDNANPTSFRIGEALNEENVIEFRARDDQEGQPTLDRKDRETLTEIAERLQDVSSDETSDDDGDSIESDDTNSAEDENDGQALDSLGTSEENVNDEGNIVPLMAEPEDLSGDASEISVEQTGEPTTEIIENLASPVLIYQPDRTLFANSALLEMAGYGSLDALADAGGIDALLQVEEEFNFANGGDQFLKTSQGEQIPVHATLKSVPWSGEKALMLTFNPHSNIAADSTKIAIDMARISEMQNILDTATDGIIVIDNEGNIQSVNGSAEALFGVEQTNVVETKITNLFATESHESLNKVIATIAESGDGAVINNGLEAIGKESGGGLIPIFATFGKMGEQGSLCLVIRDMTSWKKVEEDLVQAKRHAEDASDQKSDFLARVSHEIRTPLNAIIGFSDVMIEERFGPVDNERYREYLRDINRSGIHVLDLINDLLDLSKIESGNIELAFEAVDLNQIVAETVALMQPQANANRIIIRTSLSRVVPKVVADARSMRQIVMNLVSNAIKFSRENGQVVVSTVYEGNGEVALRIRDTGFGMTKEELEDAMKPFHQISGVSEKAGQGTGLGLPLTKALVEANRAHFDLESDRDNGTIAHVQFPSQRVLAD